MEVIVLVNSTLSIKARIFACNNSYSLIFTDDKTSIYYKIGKLIDESDFTKYTNYDDIIEYLNSKVNGRELYKTIANKALLLSAFGLKCANKPEFKKLAMIDCDVLRDYVTSLLEEKNIDLRPSDYINRYSLLVKTYIKLSKLAKLNSTL